MNTFTNPRLLLLVGTLPLLLLLFFGYQQFTLIESLLESHTVNDWIVMGVGTAAFLLAVSAVGGFYASRRQALPLGIILFLFVAGGCFLWFALLQSERLLPWSIPRWLRSQEASLVILTAVMPLLAFCLLGAVRGLTPEGRVYKVWPNFAGALAIPLVVYVFGVVIIPVFRGVTGDFLEHAMIIGFICLTTIFLFLLVRGFYLLLRSRDAVFTTYRYLWLVPVAILFPLLGLALNNGLILKETFSADGVFGNFTNPLFYLIAGLNGLLLCLPAYESKLYRLFLYLGRLAGLAYIAYFFVVFLPFLPLSVAAVIFFGLGFLMLTPLVLLPLQVTMIREDYKYLRTQFERPFLGLLGLLAFLVLPTLLTLSHVRDRTALNQALDYVYAPAELQGQATVRTHRLRRVLGRLDGLNDRDRFLAAYRGTPYLTSYYRWVVLDNLMLSQQKTNILRRVFFGEGRILSGSSTRSGNSDIKLTDLRTETKPSPAGDGWLTNVELELHNEGQFARAEFVTQFDLPDGVFVNDYWLDIDGRREHGILAERKAATWVYTNIVNANRDPGFLRYVAAGRLALNVFPFRADERRTTGIQFLHRSPVNIELAGRTISLGDSLPPVSEPITLPGGSVYLTAEAKEALPQVQRQVGVHFVLDGSRRHPENDERMVANLQAFVATLPAGLPTPRITLAGTYPQTFSWDDDWEIALSNTEPGGFFAQRAVENILESAIGAPEAIDYQVVIVPTGVTVPVFTGDFSAFAAAYPEGDDFYFLSSVLPDLNLHHLVAKPDVYAVSDVVVPNVFIGTPVRVFTSSNQQKFYLPDNGLPSLIPAPEGPDQLPDGNQTNDWGAATSLYARHLTNQWSGQTGYRPWLLEVQGSFKAGVLMPQTAYLALENEAQKEALRRKQAETLAADPALDVQDNEDVRSMSEPWWVWVLGLLLFVGMSLRRRI